MLYPGSTRRAGSIPNRRFAETMVDIDRALAAAPRQMKEGATVIKWNADFTYDTLKKGTNRLVCYDRSTQPGRQPFAVQCTSIGNLERVAQNRKFEAEPDVAKRKAMIEAAEANGGGCRFIYSFRSMAVYVVYVQRIARHA